jgi:membrane-bound lytic murein transglycosylase F
MTENPKTTVSWVWAAALLALMVLAGCRPESETGLDRIWRQGRITVLTENNAHCYYIYRDRPVGFEYELAAAFARHLVVDLKVSAPGWEEMFEMLAEGRGDVIAASVTRTPRRNSRFDFSDGYLTIQQHIIVHQRNRDIRSIEDLNGRTVHVRSGTSYEQRLEELISEGLAVNLIRIRNVPTEELIRQVAESEIEITVADTNVAQLNRRYYPDVDVRFPISERQVIAWAVRKGDQALLTQINRFFTKIFNDGTFERLHHKYYSNVDVFDYFDLKVFHRRIETRLPEYETVIRRESRRHGFDWRLVAAVIYQESHFNPRAVSYTGVRGLMQLTTDTAEELGVNNRLDPEQSIAGGVKYLRRLYDRFEDIPGFDRMLFTLASYNVGYGHVRDAQKIAAAKKLDPTKWSSLKEVLPLLRYPAYYQQAEFGYARGTESVRYVRRILTYYDILRRTAISREEYRRSTARPLFSL